MFSLYFGGTAVRRGVRFEVHGADDSSLLELESAAVVKKNVWHQTNRN